MAQENSLILKILNKGSALIKISTDNLRYQRLFKIFKENENEGNVKTIC